MKAKKLELTIEQMYAMRAAIQAMDSYDHSVTEGGKERVVRLFYKLGVIRLQFAKNLNRLKIYTDAFEAARDALVKECSGGRDQIKPEDEGWEKFRDASTEMFKKLEEVELFEIETKDLCLDDNPFPVMALSALEPILTGED